MSHLNLASAACIAVIMLSGNLACSPSSAKSGADAPKANLSPNPSVAETPANPATPPASPDKDPAKPAVPLPGGPIDTTVKDPDVIEAANFACTAEQDALKAQGKPQAITLVEIAAAQSQVVQGVSYSLTLHVKVDGEDQTANAVVWARGLLKGDDKFKLTSWKIADKK